ncbi:MAG: hypothetical protein ACK54C_08845, partial [Betaproteobacteria bacterium]
MHALDGSKQTDFLASSLLNFAALFQEERGGVSKFCAGAMVWRYSGLSERCSMVFEGFGGV